MNYVYRFLFAKEKYFLEEAAFTVSHFKEKTVLDASLERLLDRFFADQAEAIALLDAYVATLQTDSSSAPKQ